MAFNLDQYETVDDRRTKFHREHPPPSGRIRTRIIQYPYGASPSYVVRARIYIDAHLVGEGHAEETPGEGHINQTSALENCETSAVGRALVNAGYSSKKGPSREEMVNADAERQRLTDLQDQAKAMVDQLDDPAEWEAWKKQHRNWHRTVNGLRDAMHALGGLLAAQGIDPFLHDDDRDDQ